MSTPSVTVIMRTKNVEDIVGQALDGLFAQDFSDFQVMVVDSGSTDGTRDVVGRYPATVRVIRAEDYVPGPVLNEAIRRCSSELVVFQNSDVVPLRTDALSSLVAAFQDPEVMAAFGRQLPRPEAHTWVRGDYARAFPAAGPAPEWLPFSLPFAAMRRSAWEARPFYDAAWGSEDTDWGVAARDRGWRIAYVPEAAVMHSHNYTLRQLYGRRFIEGEADAFIYGRAEGAAAWLRRALGSMVRDVADHLRVRDVAGLFQVPARRAVYHWAYGVGYRLGTQRRLTGDADVSVGQRTVLSRYGG